MNIFCNLNIGRTKHYMQDEDDRLEEIRESNHPALRSRGLIESEGGRPSVDQQLYVLYKIKYLIYHCCFHC